MQADLSDRPNGVSRRAELAKRYSLFNLNISPLVSALARWIHFHTPKSDHASAVITSNLTSLSQPHAEKGQLTESLDAVKPYSPESAPSYDSDSIVDTDSDCTLRNVDSNDSLSSDCYSRHDFQIFNGSSPHLKASETPGSLLDSQVFVFDEASCTDGLDFWCAGGEELLSSHQHGPVPYEKSPRLKSTQTRPWSMPSHACEPVKRIPARPPRYHSHHGDVRGSKTNIWGRNPPVGYI